MGIRFGILATYTPTQCGIATFTEALSLHLQRLGAEVGIVRMVDEPQPAQAMVVHEWVSSDRGSAPAVVTVLDSYDVAVVQHEYGIFGGPDGQDVLDVVRQLSGAARHRPPHGPHPSDHQPASRPCRAVRPVDRAGHHDRDRPDTAHRGLGRRSRPDHRHHARCRGQPGRPARQPPHPWPASHRPHLGPAGRGQGHRMGAAGLGRAARSHARPALPDRRPDAPSRPRARRRGLPRPAGGDDPRARHHVDGALRRGVPVRTRPAADRPRRRRHPLALRLTRPGHLGRAHRGGRRRQAGHLDRVPARRANCCPMALGCWSPNAIQRPSRVRSGAS